MSTGTTTERTPAPCRAVRVFGLAEATRGPFVCSLSGRHRQVSCWAEDNPHVEIAWGSRHVPNGTHDFILPTERDSHHGNMPRS